MKRTSIALSIVLLAGIARAGFLGIEGYIGADVAEVVTGVQSGLVASAMQPSVYDPTGGVRQVAFEDDLAGVQTALDGKASTGTVAALDTRVGVVEGWGDHAGVYLPIDGTADAAEKLVSADGLTWLVMASQTGTLYWVGEGADTNTVVVTGTLNPDATGEYLFTGEQSGAPYWQRLDGAEVYFTGGSQFEWRIANVEWTINQDWARAGAVFGDDPLDFLLGEYVPGASSTGTATVSYGTIPVTNSTAITTADALAAAIAALNLGTMAEEDAGIYYDKTETDAAIAGATNAAFGSLTFSGNGSVGGATDFSGYDSFFGRGVTGSASGGAMTNNSAGYYSVSIFGTPGDTGLGYRTIRLYTNGTASAYRIIGYADGQRLHGSSGILYLPEGTAISAHAIERHNNIKDLFLTIREIK